LVQIPSLEVGDCIAHHGNVLHAASESRTNKLREAITFSYIDANAVKLPPDEDRPHGNKVFEADGNTEDVVSFMRWWNSVKSGEVLKHSSLPIVWPPLEEHRDPERPLDGPVQVEHRFVVVEPDEAWSNIDEDFGGEGTDDGNKFLSTVRDALKKSIHSNEL
jgi:hypothetical protein